MPCVAERLHLAQHVILGSIIMVSVWQTASELNVLSNFTCFMQISKLKPPVEIKVSFDDNKVCKKYENNNNNLKRCATMINLFSYILWKIFPKNTFDTDIRNSI